MSALDRFQHPSRRPNEPSPTDFTHLRAAGWSWCDPSTIVVDGDVVVRWIDQATDYRVLGAIREALS